MAATYPSNQPDRPDDVSRPRLEAAPEPTTTARRSRWPWVALGVVVIVAIAVIAYFALYGGGGGTGGTGGGGGGGGGYFILALPLERVARLVRAHTRRS